MLSERIWLANMILEKLVVLTNEFQIENFVLPRPKVQLLEFSH